MMLQETLKQATQQNHDELEKLMYVQDIMNGSLTIDQYKRILLTNYIVHEHVEDQLHSGLSPQLANELELNKRAKLPALTADMREAGLSLSTAEHADVPAVSFVSDAEKLGALYVLEGATLGGNVIIKRLAVNQNLNNSGLGFHYYQVYGEQLIPYWKNFCAVINRQPETTREESVCGARKMFDFISAVQQATVEF